MYLESNHRDGLSEDDDDCLPLGRATQSNWIENIQDAHSVQKGEQAVKVVIEQPEDIKLWYSEGSHRKIKIIPQHQN